MMLFPEGVYQIHGLKVHEGPQLQKVMGYAISGVIQFTILGSIESIWLLVIHRHYPS